MNISDYFNQRQSRRSVLQQFGALASITSVSLMLDACGTGSVTSPNATPPLTGPGSIDSIQHIIIACQENRTFDEYFGHYPKAGDFGVPANFSVPDGKGGTARPYHFTSHDTKDIAHTWAIIHKEWNNGKMDGFFTADGMSSLGYYDGSDIPYYYALADSFTLCGNYFSYQLGSTLPNRIALWAGTSGGITMNHRVPSGSLNWPTIVDLLEDHGITWKCYNLGSGLGSVPEVEFFNALPFFKRWYKDKRLKFREDDYYNDLKSGNLPQVTFLISDAFTSEHPPLSIRQGELKMAQVINALIKSSLWTRSALFLTYDEGGGYFDHIPPPQFDAYGAGMRVPALVISPWAKRGYVSRQLYEHNSLLKFIERRFGLPTLTSVNHLFDTSTPATYNDAAQGGASGPPAPPRDNLARLGDFYEAFDFSQDPNYSPNLPTRL